jgi:hypothetical protein
MQNGLARRRAQELLRAAGIMLLLALTSRPALAQSFCVYDPMGAAGDYYSLFTDYQLQAKRWNVSIELVPYTDDNKLIDAFESGRCDMASMIGFRARKYNQFTGTIDAPSTIENYMEMHDLLNLLASPKLDKYMVSGGYEVVGVLPVGAGYAMVDDRNINNLAAAVGKKVTVPKFDKSLLVVVNGIKAKPVLLDLLDYGGSFAKGDVDIIMIPLVLYKPLEIEKTLVKTNGGIIRRPLFELTMQVVAHHDKFPDGFGRSSREFVGHQADHALGIARNLENQVDSKYWIYAKHLDFDVWNKTMRDISNEMVKQGFLDKRMLGVLRRIRCKSTPDEPECRALNEQAHAQGSVQ